MLQIAVCEDEQADRDHLIGILKPLLDKYIESEEYRITNFISGGELLQSDDSFHLIFMDIMMEGRNGIETGQELYSRNHSAKIIYITNFGQYCMDAVNTVQVSAKRSSPAFKLQRPLDNFCGSIGKKKCGWSLRTYPMRKTASCRKSLSCCFPLIRSCTLNTSRRKRRSKS